jgi:Calcineurin-like phosphoesterase
MGQIGKLSWFCLTLIQHPRYAFRISSISEDHITLKKSIKHTRRRFLGDLAGIAGLGAAGMACDPGSYLDHLTNQEDARVNDRYHESRSGHAKELVFPTAGSNQFNFLWASDIHVAEGESDNIDKLGDYAIDRGSVFVLHSGDCADHGYGKEFQKWNERTGKHLPCPMFTALGNHDVYNDGWDKFKKYIGPSVFNFTYAKAEFIFLDLAAGTLGKDQVGWLERTLKKRGAKARFALGHYPIYDGTLQTPSSMGNTQERMMIIDLFDEYGVDYYLAGHKHTEDHYSIRSTKHIISGCASTYKNIIDDDPHFYRFDVDGGNINKKKIYFDDVKSA